MSRPHLHAYPQAGLTLVELLFALAIAAVLMVPLAATFQTAAGSGIAVRAALDLNADARFALDRIARRAAVAPSVSSGAEVSDPGPWLAPLSYKRVGTSLVETDAMSTPARTSVIATNVSAFRLSVPDIGDGQAMMKIELTLAAQGRSVSASRTVRVGAPL